MSLIKLINGPAPTLPFFLLCLLMIGCQRAFHKETPPEDSRRVKAQRRQRAQDFVAEGQTHSKALRFGKARTAFEKALTIDPENKVAQHHLRMIGFVTCDLNPRPVDLKKRGLQTQKMRSELTRLFHAGTAHLSAREYAKAQSAFLKILELVKWSPSPLCSPAFTVKVKDLLSGTKRQLRFQKQRSMREELKRRTIPLSLRQSSLKEALAVLRGSTWVTIKAGARLKTEGTISLQRESVSIWQALFSILAQTNLALRPTDDGFELTELRAKGAFVLERYPFADVPKTIGTQNKRVNLVLNKNELKRQETKRKGGDKRYGPESFIALIKSAVKSGDWNGLSEIEWSNGELIIFQTRPVQRQIRSFLARLKSESVKKVKLEFNQRMLSIDQLCAMRIDLRVLAQYGAPIFGSVSALADPKASAIVPLNPESMIPMFGVDSWSGWNKDIIEGVQGGFLQGARLSSTKKTVIGGQLPGDRIQGKELDRIRIEKLLSLDKVVEKSARVVGPVFTLLDGESFSLSAKFKRSYVADYELSSAGIASEIIADPIIKTFDDSVNWNVRVLVSETGGSVTLNWQRSFGPNLSGAYSLRLPRDGVIVFGPFQMGTKKPISEKTISLIYLRVRLVEDE